MGTNDCQSIKLSLISLTRNKFAARDRQAGTGSEVDDLVQSMKQHGLIEPIVVHPVSWQGKYEIIAGNRRYLAAKELDWEKIPALIKDVTDIQLRRLAFVENVHREDLSDVEKARSIAAIYGDIGFDAKNAQTILYNLYHKSLDFGSKVLRENFKKSEKEFMAAYNDISMADITQSNYLRLLTHVEPEILEEAERQGLSFKSKTLLTSKEIKHKNPEEKKRIQKEIIKNVKDYKGRKAREKAEETIRKYVPKTPKQEGRENLLEKVMSITSATDKLIELITSTPLGRVHVHYTDKMINDAKPKIFAFIKAMGDTRQLDAFEEDMSILEYLLGIIHETIEQVRKSNEKQREILKP